MQMDGFRPVAPQAGGGGPGEKAGGAGDAGEGPQGAGPAGQVWMQPLQPEVGAEACGQQKAAVADPAQDGAGQDGLQGAQRISGLPSP